MATVLDRFKIEIQKDYLSDDTYSMLLLENELEPTAEYSKSTMQRGLLLTVYDVLQMLSNDIELFRKIETEYATTSDAYTALQKRLNDVEKRINSIPDPTTQKTNVSYLFYSA